MSDLSMIHQLENEKNVINRGNSKEELRMTLVNMAMNIGTFKINFTVNKNHELAEKKSNGYDTAKRVQEAIVAKNDALLEYGMYNFIV